MNLGDIDSNWSTDTICPWVRGRLGCTPVVSLDPQGLLVILPYWQAAQKGV